MPTHVTVRLYWHDSGWNGSICRDPAGNVWCEAHDHVRTNKDVDGETKNAGQSVDQASVMPGCEMSIQAFSRRANTIRDWPPDWMASKGVSPIDRPIAALSAPMWPYENMWTEDGSHKSNEERRRLAEEFFREIEPKKSLAFFYVDERNPVFVDDGERSPARVLAGISRVVEVGDIREWEEAAYAETNMVWSVPFRHAFPEDGIRLPLQALVAQVSDADNRQRYAVPLDESIRTDFRYGSNRLSLDRAVAVVERAIVALRRLKEDNVPISVDAEIEWLNGVLLELWDDRGPYPGLAPILLALGCSRATEVQKALTAELAQTGADPAQLAFRALDGEQVPQLAGFADSLAEASFEWEDLDTEDQTLARLLVRMELTAEQARAALFAPDRTKHRLPSSAGDLLENPFLLCERYTPRHDKERISFATVDHALLPHDSVSIPTELRVSRRDPRRFRALLTEVLNARAASGDTFVQADDACAAAADRSPEDRRCDVDWQRLSSPKFAEVVDHTIERFEVGGERYVALRSLHAQEEVIEAVLAELASRPPLTVDPPEWQVIADDLAKQRQVERVTLTPEQETALGRSLQSALSVITGAAGTGKSTLLAPLVAAIQREEGRVPIRALAPTGKAADRLKTLGVGAMTIHRALALGSWYDWDLGVWVEDGDVAIAANTLIIDEGSMVDITMLSTLFRAVDWHAVRRLVLVGDHHQLPPIGPGRPFFDLIAAMKSADVEGHGPYSGRLNELTENHRVSQGSKAIALANSFAATPEPDAELIWSSVAKGEDQGDLRVRYWTTAAELYDLIESEIKELIVRDSQAAGFGADDWDAFDKTIGHNSDLDASHWQILDPLRGDVAGTRKLNGVVQDRFHGWAKRGRRAPNGAIIRWPVRFGDEQITSRDKVIQIANQRLPAIRTGAGPGQKKEKVALFNGQIGTVRREYPVATHKYRSGQKGPVRTIAVAYDNLPGFLVDYAANGWLSVNKHLELAYAITVHKGQGSQFKHVFFVLPATAASYFGRELAYTGLTRAQETLTLLLERDIGPLLGLSKHAAAHTPQRNSRLFTPKAGALGYRADALVYVTTRGDYVASKSEVIIGNLLHTFERNGDLSFEYERVLPAPGGDEWDFRLPDFTVRAQGQTWYWEHCGMYGDPAYKQKWDNVRLPWYKRHGFEDQLIVTYEGPKPGLRADELEQQVILGKILGR